MFPDVDTHLTPSYSTYLDSFITDPVEVYDMPNRGFGSEEDNTFLSTINPLTDLDYRESNINIDMLRADDELIDSLPMNHLSFTSTPSSRSWKSVLLKNPVPPSLPPPSLSPPSPSPEPASPSSSLHKPRKVCQYWLAVPFFFPHLTAREIACMAISAGTLTPSTRKPPSRSWSTARSAAFARKTC